MAPKEREAEIESSGVVGALSKLKMEGFKILDKVPIQGHAGWFLITAWKASRLIVVPAGGDFCLIEL